MDQTHSKSFEEGQHSSPSNNSHGTSNKDQLNPLQGYSTVLNIYQHDGTSSTFRSRSPAFKFQNSPRTQPTPVISSSADASMAEISTAAKCPFSANTAGHDDFRPLAHSHMIQSCNQPLFHTSNLPSDAYKTPRYKDPRVHSKQAFFQKSMTESERIFGLKKMVEHSKAKSLHLTGNDENTRLIHTFSVKAEETDKVMSSSDLSLNQPLETRESKVTTSSNKAQTNTIYELKSVSFMEHVREVTSCLTESKKTELMDIIPVKAEEAHRALTLVDVSFSKIISTGLSFVLLKTLSCREGCHSCVLFHGDIFNARDVQSIEFISHHLGSVLSLFSDLTQDHRLMLGYHLKNVLNIIMELPKLDELGQQRLTVLREKIALMMNDHAEDLNINRALNTPKYKSSNVWGLEDESFHSHLKKIVRETNKDDTKLALEFMPDSIGETEKFLSEAYNSYLGPFIDLDNIDSSYKKLSPLLDKEGKKAWFYLYLTRTYIFNITPKLTKKQKFLIWFYLKKLRKVTTTLRNVTLSISEKNNSLLEGSSINKSPMESTLSFEADLQTITPSGNNSKDVHVDEGNILIRHSDPLQEMVNSISEKNQIKLESEFPSRKEAVRSITSLFNGMYSKCKHIAEFIEYYKTFNPTEINCINCLHILEKQLNESEDINVTKVQKITTMYCMSTLKSKGTAVKTDIETIRQEFLFEKNWCLNSWHP